VRDGVAGRRGDERHSAARA